MSQNFENHRRYYAWHHFLVQPILTLNVFVEGHRLYKYGTAYNFWLLLVAIALLGLSFTARAMALKVQNRVIRLEERLRLASVLAPDDRALIDKLATRQLIALRFASDDELPELVRKCAAGQFNSTTEIKKSIRNWRGDYLRV